MTRKILATLYAHHRLILCAALLALAACGPNDPYNPCG
jgi:hypothetical protein